MVAAGRARTTRSQPKQTTYPAFSPPDISRSPGPGALGAISIATHLSPLGLVRWVLTTPPGGWGVGGGGRSCPGGSGSALPMMDLTHAEGKSDGRRWNIGEGLPPSLAKRWINSAELNSESRAGNLLATRVVNDCARYVKMLKVFFFLRRWSGGVSWSPSSHLALF